MDRAYYVWKYQSPPPLGILCANFLVVNKYNAHVSFPWVKLNKDRLRCTEIIWKAELISDVSYQNVM